MLPHVARQALFSAREVRKNASETNGHQILNIPVCVIQYPTPPIYTCPCVLHFKVSVFAYLSGFMLFFFFAFTLLREAL